MDVREKTWHGLRAAGLSLLPGLGHLYIGAKRGFWLLAVGFTLFVISRFLWPPALWLYLGLAIVSACDAYVIVKRDRGLM